MKIWLFVLPATPWVFLAIIASVAYIVMQAVFGFNLFQTIIRFGDFAPPGVLIAAIAILISLLLWAFTVTVTGYLRATARTKSQIKP